MNHKEDTLEVEDLVVVTLVIVEVVVGTFVTVQRRMQNLAVEVEEVLTTKGAVKVAIVWYLLQG